MVELKYKNRVSGVSGRTAGKMHRAFRANPSSERRGLRAHTQPEPKGKDRYPHGGPMHLADPTGTKSWAEMGWENPKATKRLYDGSWVEP